MNDLRADKSDQRQDTSETRADVSETRADVSETRADASDKRQDIGDTRVEQILKKVAVAITIITFGCIGGLYAINEAGEDRAEKNSCVIRGLIDIAVEADPTISEDKQFYTLKKQLSPPNEECAKILK